MALSPMMQQYNRIKEEYSDCLIMFRLGDFYELFFDDAEIASRILELTLTGRNCGLKERAPMCGVPHHAVDSYINKLVRNGYKVAICEQIEDPADAKGIVQRDVIRVITPGTVDADISDGSSNIYISSLCFGTDRAGIAFADISTGELFCSEIDISGSRDLAYAQLEKNSPKELIISSDEAEAVREELKRRQIKLYINELDPSYYAYDNCSTAITTQLDIQSLISLGIGGKNALVSAVGSLLQYLNETQKQIQSQITELTIKNLQNTMQLDNSTIRNLELTETIYDNDVHGSLLGVIDKTKTAMGARLLKTWVKEPLINIDIIQSRLDAVEELASKPVVCNNIGASLRKVYDFQRLSARIASNRANARDLVALKQTLGELPLICEQLQYIDSSLIREIKENISDFGEIYSLIDRAICDEPPLIITEGGLIKDKYSEELDSIKLSIKDAKLWIMNLEQSERERTGIKTIKLGFNKVFGYYIDVSKGMLDRVPDNYIRKQTLVNNERFITPELKEKESLVLSAETRINSLEYKLFCDIRSSVMPYLEPLQKAAHAIAVLDVLIGFAIVATENAYVKPVIDESDVIDIRNGRHPCVESIIGPGLFVGNDTLINRTDRSMLIITGPNMAGKSTYMRQTAVIVLMAQIGCYVPADYARIGVVDRIFTRIGASDNLAYGQSTFFIEMSELANILRNAGPRSLIILDEIGRGTSTWDGLSIAWATVEYLCKEDKRIRTMFATHYHELTSLDAEYSCIQNLSVSVAEDRNDVIFLHNIIDSPASKSYGIHVAKIAGVPEEIRRRARAKLNELEAVPNTIVRMPEQLSLFDYEKPGEYDALIAKLSAIDINTLTPLAALNELQSLIEEAKDIGGCI